MAEKALMNGRKIPAIYLPVRAFISIEKMQKI
jgi:hypothetical protein